MRFSILILIFVNALSFSAQAMTGPSESKITDACSICVKMDELRAAALKGPDRAIDDADRFLSNMRLSSNKELRSREIDSFLKLSVVLIPKDPSHMAGELLYAWYSQYKSEFANGLIRMPRSEARLIQKELDEFDKNSQGGNG